MKKYLLLIFLIPFIYGCKSIGPASSDKSTLFSINDQPVTNEEFLYVYQKNNFNDTLPPRQSVDHYLDLFINFKLKVAEARQRGLHNTQEFIQEFDTYKEQLTEPYLQAKEVTDQLVEEAYERMKEEVNASHILIQLPKPAMPADTIRVYNELIELRKKALAGEDFSALAHRFSQDPSAQSNKGELGYFSALQMVYPFEEVAYTTPEGEISKPFRTRFGYHLLKVNDRRPSQGEVKVSHIMIRATEGLPVEDSLQARQKIANVYQNLEDGAAWDQMVQQYSEDLNTKNSGGTLPWLSTGNIHPAFGKVAFSLQEKGQYSAPVKTPYGWHIIRLEEKKGLQPLAEIENQLREKIKKDSRSQLQQSHLIRRLKKENNYSETDNIEAIVADSALLKGKWQPVNDTINPVILFTIGQKTYDENQLYNFIKNNQQPQNGISPDYYLQLLYKDFAEQMLIDYEKEHLAEKYPEYRYLLKEYEEGILLFQLMDEQVWSKAAQDTTGLKEFFKQNTHQYQWNERAQLLMLQTDDKNILDSALAMLTTRYYPIPELSFAIDEDINLELILNKVNQEVQNADDRHVFIHSSEEAYEKIASYLLERGISANQLHFQVSQQPLIEVKSKSKKALSLQFPGLIVEEGTYEKSALPVLTKINWQPGVQAFKIDGNYYHINIEKIINPQPKKLNEIKGRVIADYQDYLEENWIKELKQKYSVEVNEKARKKLYKYVAD